MAQEATRLADLGLPPREIAARLEVQLSTVTRWMAAGKLPDTRRGARAKQAGKQPRSAAEWAAAVRAEYALDATDEELVTAGELVLRIMHDPRETTAVRLNATGRFIAITKKLDLVARRADAAPPVEEQKKEPAVREKRQGPDPRSFLQAVK